MDYRPLLQAGLHPKTWSELEQLCVSAFPLSRSRAIKFSGLRRIVDRILAEGIEGDLWVNGSFLTNKIEPGDIDIVLSLDFGFLVRATPAQQLLLSWLGATDAATRAEIMRDYSCDSYFFCDVPAGHLGYTGPDMRQYWLNQFGSGRGGSPKGIAVLSIPGGVL
jgi:hypothetical protein